MVGAAGHRRTHREEQTLYEIAQALGSSLGVVGRHGADRRKGQPLVPFVTCALFLGDDDRRICLPLRARPRHRSAVQVGRRVVERNLAAAARCADGRGAHGEELTSLLPCPLTFEGRLIGGLVIYHSSRAASPTSTGGSSAA